MSERKECLRFRVLSLSQATRHVFFFFLSSLCSSIGDIYWKRLRLGIVCLKLGSSTG